MFSGIVETTGRIHTVEPIGNGRLFDIEVPFASELEAGQSVAVAGVCLTVTEATRTTFRVTAVTETLSRTILGDVHAGDAVNLERALAVGDRLDGHFVQGHVDGVGRVTGLDEADPGLVLRVSHPVALAPFIAEKGSIAVDGVSLTVVSAGDTEFSIALVPHTLSVTTFGSRSVGDAVNLEVDVLARYLHRLSSAPGLPGVEKGTRQHG